MSSPGWSSKLYILFNKKFQLVPGSPEKECLSPMLLIQHMWCWTQALEFRTPPFSSFGPFRDYGMDLCLEVYLWTIYPYFTTFRVTTLVLLTGAWGMDFASSSPFSLLPPLFSKCSYKSFLFQNFHNHSFFLHLTISVDVIHHE